jgi:hypothetical protein
MRRKRAERIWLKLDWSFRTASPTRRNAELLTYIEQQINDLEAEPDGDEEALCEYRRISARLNTPPAPLH